MKKLSSVATIIPGHQFRKGVSDDPAGDAMVLQIKDITRLDNPEVDRRDSHCSAGRKFNWSQLDRVDGSKIREACFARKDDILFVYRGEKNTFFHLYFQPPRLVIPNYFFIIRVHDPMLSPAFLYWCFKQKPLQKQIERIRLGTSVSMISREGISELDIPLPPLEKQKQISEFGVLIERELKLLNRINTRRYELTQQMLIDNTITAGA
jgi:hypothetical protein